MRPPPPKKLLAIAYSCAPMRGSEWGLGWNFAAEFAQEQPVWVITHTENRAAIEAYLSKHPTPFPIHFEFVSLPTWLHRVLSHGYTLFNIQYYLWTLLAARAARRLHKQLGFDIVQHISLMRWWMPSPGTTLAKRGVRFVFGPVGGGELMPRRFRTGIGVKARCRELIRKVAVTCWGFDPLLRRSIRQASVVLASTPETARHLARFKPKSILTVTGGVMSGPEVIESARTHRASLPTNRPFRFVSSGGLSYYRGVDLALRAFARANLPEAEYVHTSDGPDRPRLEALAHDLGIASRVKFLGDHPHAENVRTVATADVYVHTVLRDSMGLIPDALALGIPVLTLDHNTMAVMVNESVGHKVPMDESATPELVIQELSEYMRRWHDDRAEREALGVAAVEFSQQFTRQGRMKAYREYHLLPFQLISVPALDPVSDGTYASRVPASRKNPHQTSSLV